VTQAIGMESLAFLKKVIQGDKRLFEDYMGIRGPKGQTKPTWITEQLTEEEIESLRTELVKRVYMWPIQGEASPAIWSLMEDGISPEAAEQKRAAEQKKLIELVRCIATSEAALFHHISILHSGAEMISLPNRYGKGKDLERPEHVVKDIVSALHASGWFSNHSIEEDIASILQYKHTPYSLPLYSLGNVLFDIYMVARGIIYDPNSGLSAPVIKPGAPVIHKIEITSKTTFTTETQKTYLMKRDLFDGVCEVLSEHTMVTKTDWDAAQQMLVKATFSIDGSFTEKASPLVRQAITLHWQEKSDKRLKAQLEK
jgi:ribosomal protein L32